METLDLLFREKTTGKKIVAHFQFTELEWLGIVERTHTAEGFRFTELGEELLRTYSHPLEFAEAVRRVGYNKVRSSNLPAGSVRKH